MLEVDRSQWRDARSSLKALKEADLIEPERDGNSMRYRLEISALEEAVAFLLGVVEPASEKMRGATRKLKRRTT